MAGKVVFIFQSKPGKNTAKPLALSNVRFPHIGTRSAGPNRRTLSTTSSLTSPSRSFAEFLSGLNEAFPENDSQNQLDDDLIRPWSEADEASKSNSEHSQELKDALGEVKRSIDELYKQWNQGHSASTGDEFSAISRQAAENAAALPPPNAGKHPLIHTWQHSRNEWKRLVASYAYRRCPNSRFILHAFGETLCEIKASVSPSRLITNEVVACYQVNQKMVAHLTANELPVDEIDDVDEYEDGEAIEAMLSF